MRLLLDTHAFLWFLDGDSRISPRALRRIEDARNATFLSVASVWEIASKLGTGKLELSRPLTQYIDRGTTENTIALLDIRKEHALAVAALPRHHADPFDRLIIAQAISEDMSIVARDGVFDRYPVKRIW